MSLRPFHALLLAFVTAALLSACDRSSDDPEAGRGIPRPTCSDCNVVLVSVDTLRADHLSTFGYTRDTSPNLDALARESLVFTDVWAQSPWTLSSQMSILTGRYPSRHGVRRSEDKLSDAIATLASMLGANGYSTAAFTGGGYMSRTYNYHGFEIHEDRAKAAEIVKWLEERGDRPFFLFWQTYLVHCPYSPRPEHDLYSDADYVGVVQTEGKGKCSAYYHELLPELEASDLQHIRDKYDGEIHQLDELLGVLISLLQELGHWEKTVVVFTSDHGESFADHSQRPFVGHHLMYEEVLQVPLVLRVPGYRPRSVDLGIESIDILPTLLGILGIEKPAEIDGRDLFDRESGQADGVQYSEHFAFYPEYSVKKGNFKLIHTLPPEEKVWTPLGLRLPRKMKKSGRYELYDLRADPSESNNLFGSGLPVEAELVRLLQERRNVETLEAPSAEIDEEVRDQLEALGYLN